MRNSSTAAAHKKKLADKDRQQQILKLAACYDNGLPKGLLAPLMTWVMPNSEVDFDYGVNVMLNGDINYDISKADLSFFLCSYANILSN